MSNSTRPDSDPRTTSVLVSGAGIAGTALAYWLNRYGFHVTVVERAPSLRGGGQAVDIRGTALTVVERMGLLEEVRARRTGLLGMSVVDADGRELNRSTEWTASGGPIEGPDVEILRDELAELIVGAEKTAEGTGAAGAVGAAGAAVTAGSAGPGVEYRFDDAIETLVQHPEGVEVRFRSGTERSFDLVVGADGLHSNTRRLVFGPEADYLHPIGTYLAGWSAPNHLGLDRWEVAFRDSADPNWFCMAMTVRENSELRVFVGFHSDEPLDDMLPREPARQRALVAERSAHARWEVPRFLRAMEEPGASFHYDVIAQIRMDRWSKNRVVLLGDAGYCCSPATGQGTSVALTAAYVLAGELHAADGDHRTAFPAYERRLRDHVAANQAILEVTGDRKARSELVTNLGLVDPRLEALHQAALAFDLPDY